MIGKLIADYSIIEKIGQGGMGEVYKAVHTKLDQTVAIKVLSSEYSLNPSMRKRFINEARIQAKFSHPNLVNIFNLVERDSNVFIVMEYINGGTLEQYLENSNVLTEDESISISKQVLNALQFMHSKGVVHRDIKPSNIMFTEGGEVKVADFGIAKVMNEATKHTKTGMLGSVIYVSPEQILGEKTSIATDIYSFGITLYRMVTGRTPFRGNSEYKVMQGHLKEKPIPPIKFNSNISKSLNKIILKSISKEPKKRYSSVSEFTKSITNIQNNQGVFNNFFLYVGDKIENVSEYGPRNSILLFIGIILSLAALNYAIAIISNNGSNVNDNLISVDDKHLPIDEPQDHVSNKLNSKNDDIKVFENKYVVFEPQEDLSKLNNTGNKGLLHDSDIDMNESQKPMSTKRLKSETDGYEMKKKGLTPEFKKVYYKPKKNKIEESRSKKKWRIRK